MFFTASGRLSLLMSSPTLHQGQPCVTWFHQCFDAKPASALFLLIYMIIWHEELITAHLLMALSSLYLIHTALANTKEELSAPKFQPLDIKCFKVTSIIDCQIVVTFLFIHSLDVTGLVKTFCFQQCETYWWCVYKFTSYDVHFMSMNLTGWRVARH